MKKLISTAILALMCGIAAFAQNVSLSGVVRDSKGEPVIGAVVMLEGSATLAAVTDLDGNYLLEVPGSKLPGKVNVSCIGYKSTTLDISAKVGKLDIVLSEDVEQLDEVVVVGYGAMRRSDLTGSVASVRISDVDAAQSTSFDQLLQGHAAGVQVVNSSMSPDAEVNIRVRGMTSLTGSSEPLYVVDGVILTSPTNTVLTYGDDNSSEEGFNSLMGINPQDIASIEILKDASATAIYGSEGANGVVLITTKMSDREKPKITFSAGLDLATVSNRIDVLSFDEYTEFLEAHVSGKTSMASSALTTLNRMYDGYGSAQQRGTVKVQPVDWQDYTLQNTLSQRYYFSVSGRPQDLSYNFSTGYNKKDGIVTGTGSEQFTIRLNVEKKLLKNLKIGAKINFADISTRTQVGGSSGRQFASSSMMRSILVSRPYAKVGLTDTDEDEDWDNVEEDLKSSPLRWIKDAYTKRDAQRITPNLYVEWNITPWLTYKLSAGGDYNASESSSWKGPSVNRTTGGATAAYTDSEAVRWIVDNLLLVNKSWGAHNLSGTVGITFDSRSAATQQILGYNIAEYELQGANVNSAPNTRISYSESLVNTMSFLARAIYNYKDRYVLTGTARLDGSCKFRKDNVFSFFPSFAFAWRLKQEPWFDSRTISNAKLRLGWGRVGNSAVSSYQTMMTYSTTTYSSHDPSNSAAYNVGLVPSNIPDPDLKWETTEQWNAGIDFSMFDGRMAFTVDAYDKRTFDLLNQKTIAYSSGFSKIWVNQGSIRNRGLEFTMDLVPVRTRNFEWTVSGNISMNRNTILDIGTDSEGKEIYLTPDELTECNYYLGGTLGSGRYGGMPANIFIEGQPIGLFYGYKTDGLVQEGETGPSFTEGTYKEPGSIRYCDLNGNGYIDGDDRTVIGDPNPDFTYGFSTSFTYKSFTFSADFNGSYGNDICNSNLNVLMDSGYTNNILRTAFYDAWTPDNTDTNIPAIGKFVSSEDSSKMSDRLIEDGSFLRLAKLSASYNFKFGKKSLIRSITLGASVNNVCVWTKYSGWDPEVNSFGSSMSLIGIDNGSYPPSRSYCFDLKFNF